MGDQSREARMAEYDVCWNEAAEWSECVGKFYHSKNLDAECAADRRHFDNCIGKWRDTVGWEVRIKGDNKGEPPVQCAAMSCLFQKCLQQSRYDTEMCRRPMAQFKHCVKAYYLQEFITE